MNDVYAESSAVLRWLLGQVGGAKIQEVLAGAPNVITSALTSVEVARTLARLVAGGQLSSVDRALVSRTYATAANHWKVCAVSDEILRRASDPFPVEPVRSLDAIHLATVLAFTQQVANVDVISTDARIRDNAQALGLTVVP
jgi:PIN domain nuclease of toxin-antitoxin system